jgi:hypothetical protein
LLVIGYVKVGQGKLCGHRDTIVCWARFDVTVKERNGLRAVQISVWVRITTNRSIFQVLGSRRADGEGPDKPYHFSRFTAEAWENKRHESEVKKYWDLFGGLSETGGRGRVRRLQVAWMRARKVIQGEDTDIIPGMLCSRICFHIRVYNYLKEFYTESIEFSSSYPSGCNYGTARDRYAPRSLVRGRGSL